MSLISDDETIYTETKRRKKIKKRKNEENPYKGK